MGGLNHSIVRLGFAAFCARACDRWRVPRKKSEALARAQMTTTKAIAPIKEIILVRGTVAIIYFGLAVSTFLISLAVAKAGPIAVGNTGFESPATLTTAVPGSWTRIGTTSNVLAYNPYELGGGNVYYLGANPTTDPANGGSGYPGIFGENLGSAQHAVAGSGFQQTLSAVFTANTAYTLTVEEGTRDGTVASSTLGSEIQLLAGSTVVASAIDNVGATPGTFKDQTAFLANSHSFSALFGQALTIQIVTTLPTTDASQATDWDNVRLDGTLQVAAIPEPAGLALLGIGIAGLACYDWRRRKNFA